jgi:hypothetical protein
MKIIFRLAFGLTALLMLGYGTSLTYDKYFYFPKHAELSAAGESFAILDMPLRDHSTSDPGYYYTQAMSSFQFDDYLFARAVERFRKGPGLPLSEYMTVLTKEIQRRTKLCTAAVTRQAPKEEIASVCKFP